MTEPGHETGQIGTCGDGPQAVVLQPVRRLPEWRRMFSSASHWMLKDGKHVIAEVEAVIGNASKPAAYRIDEHDAEIAPNLRAGMLACEQYYGLVGEDCACGRRITGMRQVCATTAPSPEVAHYLQGMTDGRRKAQVRVVPPVQRYHAK